MLNKIALGGLLLTSSLALRSGAIAGFEDNGDTLKVSVRKLKSGSKNGEFFVQRQRCSVVNLTPALWDSLQDLKKDDKLRAIKKDGSFYFFYTQGGDFETRYYEKTQPKQPKPDFDKPLPGVTVFNLKVTPLSDKTTVETIENKNDLVSLTTTLSSLKLEQNEEVKEEKPSTSSPVTVSPIEMVEFYSEDYFVLSMKQLEKGYREGKLVTNHGTFSVASSHPLASNTFVTILDDHHNFVGDFRGGKFYFYRYDPGGHEMKYNEETNEWEPDYRMMKPPIEVFSLVVEKIDN